MRSQEKIYNFYLIFSSFLSEKNLPSSTSDSFIIREVEEINLRHFHNQLTYKNNHNRNVLLANDSISDDIMQKVNWVLYVEDVVSFRWSLDTQIIFYHKLDQFSEELLKFWLYHITMPVYLSLAKVYKFLHTGAVEFENEALLFMAPSFGGKSTLTSYFLKKGHALITDDKLGVFKKDNTFWGVSSHSYSRPYRQMEVLGQKWMSIVKNPLPIKVIYILDRNDSYDSTLFKELYGVEKFQHLHQGAEMNFSHLVKEYIPFLAAVANSLPIFMISIPNDLNRLEEVYNSIINHLSELKERG
ncbi:MAG: hypothetical protein JXQ67_05825 [Campylobacterales bacterium]|nr:hypothetical protein [Campylobacterales bacterium]